MSPTFEFTMAPRLGLEVSPALIAFGEMLMLPYAALQSLVDDELSANTALERLEPGECPVCRGSWRIRCPMCAVPHRGSRPDQHRPAAEVPAAESDCQALRQAVHAETSTADAAAVDHLIDSLDQHGLFDRTCAELAAELGATEQHVASLVGVIRRCGPPGVGATSMAECLLLQLDALGLPDDQLVRAVIAGHLPALARGHFTAIADALGATRDEVQRALDVIRRRLRPNPAFDGTITAAPGYVVPDVVIGADPAAPGGFRVELVEAATTRLRVRPDAPGAGAARMFLAQLRDRWETLRRVTEYVARCQLDFLAGGPARLRPLTRSEVAAALDLHESTVSRAGKPLDAGKSRCTYRWIVESDRVLGGIALRHGNSDYVLWAGHIGYGIRPSARRRGLATWAMGRMLDEARMLGLDRVLAVCAVDNVASLRTIERCGGVFEGVRDTRFGPVRRYWIEL